MHLNPLFLTGVILLALLPRSFSADTGTNPKAGPARHPRYESEYEHRAFHSTGDSELKFGWMPPLSVKTGNRYPLVICLHGSGGSVRASAVLARKSMREQFPTFVMVPEAERPFTWAKTDVIRRGSGPTDFPEKLPVLIEAVRSLMKTETIDPARIYITGQSMGGVGSWGAIARYPELFAAAAPVCGAWRVEDVPKMASVPVWAFHGEKDPTVPVRFSRELTAAVTKAGGTAKYTEYPGVGHDSWSKAYEETSLWQWIFSQRKVVTGK